MHGLLVVIVVLSVVGTTTLAHADPSVCPEECSRIRICCSSVPNKSDPRLDVCRQIYGNQVTDGVFRDPRKFVPKSNKIMNLGPRAVFSDFRCHSRYQGYFHRLWNCAVPSTPLLVSPLSSNTSWLFDQMSGEILRGLGLVPKHRRVINLKESRLRSRNKAVIVKAKCAYRPHHRTFNGYTTMPTCVKCFRNLLYGRLLQRSTPEQSCRNRTIVYIKRKSGEGRAQPGYEDLLTWFKKSFPLLPVRIFYGTESLKQTASIFNRAKVVVGPHGAGLVNTIFTQDDAYVVEITREDKPGHVWRTNIEVPKAAGASTNLFVLKAKHLIQKLKLAGKKGSLAKGTSLPVDEVAALNLVSLIANFTSSCWRQ